MKQHDPRSLWTATNSNGTAVYRFDGERLVLISDVDDPELWPRFICSEELHREWPKIGAPHETA